jgi:hypothetical protein
MVGVAGTPHTAFAAARRLDMVEDVKRTQPEGSGPDPAAVLTDRRVRALAHLLPVLELDRDKNMGRAGRDWVVYDPKLLTIVAVDKVAISDGLTGLPGMPRDELLAELASHAARCAPQRPADEHAEVARWLLDRLLNHTATAVAHEVAYVDVTDGYRQASLPVRLLFETLAEDGETLLVNADPAAVHLLISALDRNLEDAQVATDAVLAYQLQTGRLDDAVSSARQALMISRQYREQLRAFLRSTEQNLRTVDWDGQVEPALTAALRHIKERVRFERELLDHARSGRLGDSEADDDQATTRLRRRAGEIHQLMTDCLGSHAELQRDLVGARRRFRDEQARQAFAPPAPIGTVELVEEVLQPLLCAPAKLATDVADRLLEAFFAPVSPPLLNFGPLADALVRPPAERDEAAALLELDLEEPDTGLERFDVRHEAAFDELVLGLNEPVRLSALLARIEASTEDEAFAYELSLFTTLSLLRAFHPDGPVPGELATTTDGSRVRTAYVVDAPDLLIHPATDVAARLPRGDDAELAS